MRIVDEDEFKRSVGQHVWAFTDGACGKHGGMPGGWGALIGSNGIAVERYGALAFSTSTRMELTAIARALEFIPKGDRQVRVHSDWNGVLIGATKLNGWAAANWLNDEGNPITERFLWRAIHRLTQVHHVSWQWVRGHRGDRRNEAAHALAARGIAMHYRG